MPAPIDWGDVRYFLEAFRAGSLAGAARALGVEHSTIGRRLTALEEALGVGLITRRPDGLVLTAAGERAGPLAEELEAAVHAFVEAATAQRARVRLALPSTFAAMFTPHLARFHRDHPGVMLEFLSGSRAVDLGRGEAEVAVRLLSAGEDDLLTRPLGAVGWSLYASPEYLRLRPAPADPRDLAGHDLIGYDPSLASLPGAQWLEEHGRGATVVVRSREVSDVLAACVSGLGLAVLPCIAACAEPSLLRLTPEVLGSRKLGVVYRKEALRAKAVREVVDFVAEVVRGRADELAGVVA